MHRPPPPIGNRSVVAIIIHYQLSIINLIHHTFAPHATWRTCLQAKLLLLQPWKWQTGSSQELFKNTLEEQFGGSAALYASGREALLAILRNLELQSGEEVIVQGYTCAVVANAIHAAGGVPVYADIDRNTLNLTADSVSPKISNRTRAVVCQHTFGIPAPAQHLRHLCDEQNLALIEDCAHVLPEQPGEIGSHGNYLFFSFGRDKAISGITGGAAISKNSSLFTLHSSLSIFLIFRLLFYPCLYVAARPLYGIKIGKALLVLARKLGLLLPYVTDEEKKGHMPGQLHAMPNACAALALPQLQNIQKINNHRRSLVALYLQAARSQGWDFPNSITQAMPLQKFPIFVEHADQVRAELKTHNIHLEDGWTGAAVCPRSTDQAACNYTPGTCPVAETVGKTILNLPTHPTMTKKQAENLVAILNRTL